MSVDYARLRLKHHGDPEMMDRILQAECRDKCARKLEGILRNEAFRFPSLAVAEMSTSEEVAVMVHAPLVGNGLKVLDMTAGLGIDAFAMASRGCHVTAIEIDPQTADTLRHNVTALRLDDSVEVIEADSTEWLAGTDRHFDCIFIDPARRDGAGRHFTLADCHPDVTSLMPLMLSRADRVIIKASPMLNPGELDSLGAETIVVGTRRECKEMIYIAGRGVSPGRVRCVTTGEGTYTLEPGAVQSFGTPTPGQILLQPFPAVMKGGGASTITSAAKLHPFSHLFFADAVPDGFPGEAYTILDIVPFDRRGIKKITTEHPRINVAVRNFPLTAPELVKRLKVKEGGELQLFGTTLLDGEKIMVIAARMH